MLDRVWWIWQMQEPDTRVDLVPGLAAPVVEMTHPMKFVKRQAMRGKTAKDFVVELGWTAPAVTLDKLNDNLGGNDGQFCYVYV